MRKLIFVITLFFANSAGASVLVSSSVTSLNGLYTYNYTIDNTAGNTPLAELDIVVERDGPQPIPPISFTTPANWFFKVASGGIPPAEGGVWGWQSLAPASLPVGSLLTGFSFTTDEAPTTSINYFLLSNTFDYVQFGYTLAPAIYNPMPEPSTWAMLLLGFAGIAFAAYRKRNLVTA
jgi:hypothetical protein